VLNSKFVPELTGNLRKHRIDVPDVISKASGIRFFGKRIKSFVFTTDVAVIRNINADAVIAVYPFTPQPVITHSLMMAADKPVLAGVGGGITRGPRVLSLAQDAEFQGALGVVVNSPTSDETIAMLRDRIDIPIVVTVVTENMDFYRRMEAGASVFNVSGAANTAYIVRKIREQLPEVPIIATGGPTEATILETIEAGANAITYTPPTSAELFKELMTKYRMEH
jgi:hypothetical protein